jgi:hypothetical protein
MKQEDGFENETLEDLGDLLMGLSSHMSSREMAMLLPTPLNTWSVMMIMMMVMMMIKITALFVIWEFEFRELLQVRTSVVGQLPLPHLRRRRAALGALARGSRLGVDEPLGGGDVVAVKTVEVV